MKITISFKTPYGKNITANISENNFEYSLNWITINGTVYSPQRIRTVSRENKILSYIEKNIDLQERFYFKKNFIN